MRLVRCPCGCGHVFDADDPRVRVLDLSPVAVALLTYAPPRFKRGQPVSVRLLAELAGVPWIEPWHRSAHALRRAIREAGA